MTNASEGAQCKFGLRYSVLKSRSVLINQSGRSVLERSIWRAIECSGRSIGTGVESILLADSEKRNESN